MGRILLCVALVFALLAMPIGCDDDDDDCYYGSDCYDPNYCDPPYDYDCCGPDCCGPVGCPPECRGQEECGPWCCDKGWRAKQNTPTQPDEAAKQPAEKPDP